MADAEVQFAVDAASPGGRLDAWLAARLLVSRQRARRLLEAGAVHIDGRRATQRDKGVMLQPGSIISVASSLLEERIAAQPELPLDLLAQGQDWIAVNKTAGMPVHPLSLDERGTVLNAVAARWPQVQGVGEGGLRSGVVHRLDVETSGVLAVAIAQPAWKRLRREFISRRPAKVYRAVVLGAPPDRGNAVMDLRVARHRPALVRAVPAHAGPAPRESQSRRCDLGWRVIERYAEAALIEVALGTGFLHQIRAMMSAMGHPLAGDRLYCRTDRPDRTGATRPMLHAASLRLDGVDAAAPDPPDLVALIKRLRGAASTLP